MSTGFFSSRLRCLGPVVWLLLYPILCASAGTIVQFRLPFGTIEVELYDQDKPLTVQNFIRYINTGRYRDIFLHRCVTNFVVQGGKYLTVDRHGTALVSEGTVLAYNAYPAITNEFSVGRRLTNSYGTIAMARLGGVTNSATSEFFFNLRDNVALDTVDGGFTVFGRVVSGTNILNVFNQLAYTNGVIDMRQYATNPFLGNLLKELPVYYLGSRQPILSELLYVDITLFNVQVKRAANGGREISWNSVSNRLNRVEFTSSFPPTWTSLYTTNGTGARLSIVDSAPGSARFYRVRVDY